MEEMGRESKRGLLPIGGRLALRTAEARFWQVDGQAVQIQEGNK